MGAVFFMAFVLFIAIIFIVLSIAVIVIWYIRKRRGKNPKKWWCIVPAILLAVNLTVVLVPVVYMGSSLHANISNQSAGVTIDGVTYHGGFYGDLYPVFGEAGDIGSDTLEEEILFDDGNRKFRRVDFEGHDWVHSYTGPYTCGTVFCAESQWEQMRDYYADPLNFEYYYGIGYYMIGTSTSIPDIDPQKFDELMAFGSENEYQPFNSSSNKKVIQRTLRIPEDEFHQGVCFYKVSNDGYFKTAGYPMYFEHAGKLLLVFYHDGGRDNGGIKEVVAVETPDELGQYFLGLMEQY